MPYQSTRCHFGAAWHWKPIHNWSRDRLALNVEPVPPCAPRSHRQHNWRLQLLCCYATAGKSLGGAVLQIFRGLSYRDWRSEGATTRLRLITRHTVPTILFTTYPLLSSPAQKVTSEKYIFTRVWQVFHSPAAQWNKWNRLCCGPRLKCQVDWHTESCVSSRAAQWQAKQVSMETQVEVTFSQVSSDFLQRFNVFLNSPSPLVWAGAQLIRNKNSLTSSFYWITW